MAAETKSQSGRLADTEGNAAEGPVTEMQSGGLSVTEVQSRGSVCH